MAPPRPPASDRLQLEVALIGAAEPAPLVEQDESSGEPAYRVLLILAEPDLREYVRQCLRDRADVRVSEIGAGETTSDAVVRLRPDLVIADLAMLSVLTDPEGAREHSRVPLLLIGEEPPERLTARNALRGQLIEILLQPFNARRVIEAVERLRSRR